MRFDFYLRSRLVFLSGAAVFCIAFLSEKHPVLYAADFFVFLFCLNMAVVGMKKMKKAEGASSS
ncbi:hypothetical protein MUP01_12155 [Candidatus Bathyarchaeota archaeon]|nr:hypothetical protein [Candidatus Bathyarchaeota archaeon]